jgi:hypothetical protein
MHEIQDAEFKMQTLTARRHRADVNRPSTRGWRQAAFAFCISHFAFAGKRLRAGAGA